MIVDDEPMARTLFRLMLVREGYDVLEAFDGKDALEKLTEMTPDVIVLDVMMPGINGFELCKLLRSQAQTAQLPILMLSAKTDAESVALGLEAGATQYLKKPISLGELTKQVQIAIEDHANADLLVVEK